MYPDWQSRHKVTADGPPAKKRKLTTSSKLAAAPSIDPALLVPLVRHTFPVTVRKHIDPRRFPLGIGLSCKRVSRQDGETVVCVAPNYHYVYIDNNDCDDTAYKLLKDAESVPALVTRVNPQSVQASHRLSLSLDDDTLSLEVEIFWCNTTSLWERPEDHTIDVLHRYLPVDNAPRPSLEEWHPREFYDNVHVPLKKMSIVESSIDGFKTNLYPFQRRTLSWMVGREGAELNADGTATYTPSAQTELPHGFVQTRACNGQVYYVNHALAVVSSNFDEVVRAFKIPRGGLLADEMGLGKTLAVMAAVCSHRRPRMAAASGGGRLRKSGATLIITPPMLLDQWHDELTEHSSLRVVHYEGITSVKGKKTSLEEHITLLAESDIVLTTYNVIAKEVHIVKEKPDRKLRHKRVHEDPKTPLTEISWWRVCLDEAQMVESGVSNAATVARLIPREIAWAVTGTPLRQAHKDLYGVAVFLNYEPWCFSSRFWDRLVSHYRPFFRAMINTIAIRHTKDFIREDLQLPPQSRHTITLPFTAVEEQHYENLFDEMCNVVNLRADGSPRTDDWDPENPKIIEEMRRWLTRLRQTCLHPEVGHRNRKALGRGGGPLRTVEQVLDVMIDQIELNLRVEQRALLMSRIRRGQMLENAKRSPEALDLWEDAYTDATVIVEECQKRLDDEVKREQKEIIRRKEHSEKTETEDEQEVDATIQAYRQRVRSALEIQHICVFFTANAYFQLKSDEITIKPDSEEFHALEKQETEAYDAAKAIRGRLLAEVLKKANGFIKSVHEKGSAMPDALKEIEPHDQYSGIEMRRICDKFYDLCEAMNEQSIHYQSTRTKMIDFLKQSLIDDDAGLDLQGDEYEASTKHQDEMYVVMEALRVLFADRSDSITGLENQLIKHEVRTFLRNAKEGDGPAPELMLQLLAKRQELRIDPEKQGSLRSMATEARHLMNNLEIQVSNGSHRARAELDVAQRFHEYIQRVATANSKALPQLEQEVNLFRDTMNSRLEYYRALQKISDTVAPYEEERVGEPLDQDVFDDTIRGEEVVVRRVAGIMSKRRYLLHLKDEATHQGPRICTICQGEFEIGTLTVCGHQFCKECIRLWWSAHRNCPVCKRLLFTNDFHDITYKPAEMAVKAEAPASPTSGTSTNSSPETQLSRSIYSDISTKTLNEIKDIDLHGASFGSKIDMLMRHIFWLREHDYGTKSIIFSQYPDFLGVLSRAFQHNNIGYTAFDQKNGIQKFKNDPAIECFLLHAKAHSAGINLVCASHVFLCEPLLATAVELQAIARVHRIGQHNATTVWMYVINGSVEESIYDMSVARRLEHIKRNVKKVGKSKSGANSLGGSGAATPNLLGENVIDAANSLELQEADIKKLLTTGKSGGEHVDKADLWQCLFGKSRSKEQVLAADEAPASGAVGRFLRAEAAEARARC